MEWKECQIKDVCRLINGRAYSNDEMLEHGKYKIVRVGNLSGGNSTWFYSDLELPEDKYCHNGDLLFAWACTFGPHIWKEDNTIFHYHIWKIVEDKNVVDRRFYYYYLKYATGGFLGALNGSVMVHITKASMEKMNIKIPKNLADQRRIASILSSLDRKIELNNKINADLEEMAQAIFKNWFVDFEPFKDGKFVDSELGMIPEGWKVGSLGDFCNVFTGKKNTNQAIEKGLYPFFSCAPEPLASNDAIFNGKAIIIAGNGSYTGRTSFYNGGFDLYQRTYACTIREQDKENLMIFFYHMMKQFFEPTKMGGTRGSSIPYIVMGDITQQKFPYSEDWLIRFSNIANSMMDRKLRIDKENSRLSLLRDTLLPRLMSGEQEVPE